MAFWYFLGFSINYSFINFSFYKKPVILQFKIYLNFLNIFSFHQAYKFELLFVIFIFPKSVAK